MYNSCYGCAYFAGRGKDCKTPIPRQRIAAVPESGCDIWAPKVAPPGGAPNPSGAQAPVVVPQRSADASVKTQEVPRDHRGPAADDFDVIRARMQEIARGRT